MHSGIEPDRRPRWRPVTIGLALRRVLREGYTGRELRADVAAGLTVGVVALPLSMALAIASGVAPQHGLYTAIVAGAVIALCGGSKFQVSGPTAAFVVILAPIAAQSGLGGLLVATMLAGLLLVAMGLARLGRLVELVPYPVTTGFTAGIAVVIASLQIKDLLGIESPMPGPFFERMAALVHSAPGIRPAELGMGLATLALLVAWPRFSRRLPGPLVALALAGAAAFLLERFTGLSFDTVHDRFSYPVGTLVGHGIPRLPPAPVLPWHLPGAGGAPFVLSLETLRSLLPAAFTIAMLGAIESLLSAVVADGMTGKRHDPDTELVAQGLGNFVAPFFGGIAATGAIARTATNVRAGARSPIAAVVHSLFVLVAVMVAAPVLGWLPMSALAAMLLHVAWRISEARLVLRLVRRAPGSDLFVLATCFFLTVVFDMVVAVGVGIVLASLLFMRRMADVASVRLVSGEELGEANPVPPGWMCYELAGPLFFGAAQKAMSAVRITGAGVRGLVFDLRAVPMLDATGIVALEATVQRLEREGVFVVLAGVQPQPLRVLARAGFRNRPGRLAIGRSYEQAMDLVGRTRFPDAVDGEPPPT